MLERRFARHADRLAGHGIDGDIPEAAAGYGDFRRKGIESTAVVGVPTAILEAAEIRVAHQADVAGLRALDHDHVVFVEVFALVYVFHRGILRCFFRARP
ncbi:hypothetical protein D3C86_1738970 [compost metagenome]